MKRVKVIATGEIFTIPDYARVVVNACDSYGNPLNFGYDEVEFVDDVKEKSFPKDEDYWTRLEHQYAGMAMQGLSEKFFKKYRDNCAVYAELEDEETMNLLKVHADAMADVCYYFAHALVEKLKSEKYGK